MALIVYSVLLCGFIICWSLIVELTEMIVQFQAVDFLGRTQPRYRSWSKA